MNMEKNDKDVEMYSANAYSTYTQNNVGVESPEKLIEMLYEGVLRFNAQAKRAMMEQQIEKKVYWINRSVAVITELINSLDKSHGEVGFYLEGLYNYQISLLTSAIVESDTAKLDEVSHVFKGLAEAWRETTNVG